MDVVLAGFTTFGGMEYPTIIFTNPDRFTVSHELAHQYWYGIVGDNEFAEPWLDESFASWSQYLPFGAWKQCQSYKFLKPGDAITNDMAYWNAHQGSYGVIYGGGGCLLANLAHRFGTTRFVNILERYAADHWLGVARTTDFKAAIEAAAAKHLPGLDMDAYWAEWRVH
jgi:aminopeptidase N